MGLVFLVTVIIGFSNSTHSRIVTGAPPLSPFVMLHAVLFVSWFVIFWVQSMLAHGRIRLHRGLGYAATVIATFITLDGPYTAVLAVRRGVFGDDGPAFMLVMIGDVVCFAAFVAAAMYYRRKPETHKRLMLLGTMSMLPPAISRFPWIAGHQGAVGIVMLAYVVAAPLYDLLSGRRMHPASLWGGFVLLASGPIRIAISQSAAWHHFAGWLIERI